jgi:hypothetical protein
MVAAASVATAFLCAAAQAEPTPYYNVRDYVAGTGSAGAVAGTHQVSGAGGSITTIVSAGSDPSVEVTGSMATGVDGYLYGTADYDYHVMLNALSATVGEELARESMSNGDQIVGHLSGFLRVSATMNSTANVRFSALKPGSGGSTLSAGCAGYYCSGPVGFAANMLIPIMLDVHLSAFDFGCAPNPNTGFIEGDCTTGTSLVHLSVDGTLHSGPGLSGGSVDAYIDPVFTLDDTFLQDHGFSAGSLSFSQDSVSATSPAPEPAIWALMLVGFGLIGSSMRARGRKIDFSAAMP